MIENATKHVVAYNSATTKREEIDLIAASLLGYGNYQFVEDGECRIPYILSDRIVITVNCNYSDSDKEHIKKLALRFIQVYL